MGMAGGCVFVFYHSTHGVEVRETRRFHGKFHPIVFWLKHRMTTVTSRVSGFEVSFA